jgi:hypothetical protein
LKNSALKDKNGNQLVIEPQRNINDDQTKVKREKYARDITQLENANEFSNLILKMLSVIVVVMKCTTLINSLRMLLKLFSISSPILIRRLLNLQILQLLMRL